MKDNIQVTLNGAGSIPAIIERLEFVQMETVGINHFVIFGIVYMNFRGIYSDNWTYSF